VIDMFSELFLQAGIDHRIQRLLREAERDRMAGAATARAEQVNELSHPQRGKVRPKRAARALPASQVSTSGAAAR
jgi:hypothetical protein